MIAYREILRLHAKGFSNRSIAASCSCSRNTVLPFLKKRKGRRSVGLWKRYG
ncbi:LuxR C-terminal-related transcriptional regulator [Bacillus sp. JCM 19041]|uniref:LuxR C-terminal-related transcriptional regulator n=1 Tax=Bacillus sp. JCM 19041 TaxID=1460637 RepID=UPI0009E723FC